MDFSKVTFAEPHYLWLLTVTGLLFLAWIWRLVARRSDLNVLAQRRLIPVVERYAIVGDLPFWFCLLAAASLLIVALARPQGVTTAVRRGGIDVVVLQDGSASMRVKDVAGDRWQRSVRFLHTFGDSMSWDQDRIALTLFAHIAAPQIRLTKDPNTYFFFLDHLDREPPFQVDDAMTWDTNLELGVYWGIRLVERDEELHGKNTNAKMFVLITDGETWSGEVAHSLAQAVAHKIPVFVVGVGTLGGGRLPDFHDADGNVVRDPSVPLRSSLDRDGLQRVAQVGGGQYFELDRDGDPKIANAIIDAGRRMAPSLGELEKVEPLYWRFILAAAIFPFLGMLFLRDRSELWLQAICVAVVAIAVYGVLK